MSAPDKHPGGRPAGKHGTKVTKSIRISADVARYLDAHHAGGIGDFLDAKVRATKGFQEFIGKTLEKNN